MTLPNRERLIEEAADIFLRLRETPGDKGLVQRREAFLSRGRPERDAYREVVRTWGVAAGNRRPRRRLFVAAAAASILLALVLGPSIKTGLLADFQTDRAPEQITLASGDVAHLDAGTAITEEPSDTVRGVALLKGAVFFDVQREERPFVVSVGDLSVHVLGTGFEVAALDDEAWISVAEGSVEVRQEEKSWLLEPGDGLRRLPSGELRRVPIAIDRVAPWRQDRLIADGMLLAEAVEIVSRRISGPVIVVGDELRQTRVTGGFDLGRPFSALRSIVAVKRARVIDASPAMVLVLPAEGF
ncbi:MAG: FecR domain-containing protein [Pseudomonadota bacterium]